MSSDAGTTEAREAGGAPPAGLDSPEPGPGTDEVLRTATDATATPSSPRKEREPLLLEAIAVLLCVLVGVSLYEVRVPTTGVSGSLSVSSFHVLLNEPATIVLDQNVTSLHLGPIGELEVAERSPALRLDRHPDEVLASVARGGRGTLSSIRAAPGTEIGFKKDKAEPAVTFIVRCKRPRCNSSELEFVLGGHSALTVAPPVRRTAFAGRAVTKTSDKAMVGRFTPTDTTGVLFENQRVAELSFDEVEQRSPDEEVPVSRVEGGVLVLDDMNKREVTVRSHDQVDIVARSIFIRSAEFTPDGLKLEFFGHAESVKVGTGDAVSELKPTWLEWLAAQIRLTTLRTLLLAAIPLTVFFLSRLWKWRKS